MTDIVERLRAMEGGVLTPVFKEAADEIERLRGNIEFYKQEIVKVEVRLERMRELRAEAEAVNEVLARAAAVKNEGNAD